MRRLFCLHLNKKRKIMMECLTNIIGVTNDNCDCVTGGLPTETLDLLKKSTSGLYLDNLPGGVTLRALGNLDSCKSMADMSLKAIQNAAKTLQDDVTVALSSKYKKAAPNFNGTIGQMSYAGVMPISRRYQGQIVRSNPNSDAVMTVNRVVLNLTKTGLVPFTIIRADVGAAMGVEVYSGEVSSVAHSYSTLTMPTGDDAIRLPLSINGRQQDYFFLYDTEGMPDVQPKDNKIDCGCSKGTTDTLAEYIKSMGVEINSTNNLADALVSKFAQGLILDVTIKCNNAQLICREYDANEAIAVVLAYAVWYKAGELLIEEIQKSPEVNRYTTMNREYLWGKRNHFKAQYESRVNFLGESIDASASSCFVCRSEEFSGKAPIIVTDFVEEEKTSDNAFSLKGILPTLGG